jgi:hypothetical protein
MDGTKPAADTLEHESDLVGKRFDGAEAAVRTTVDPSRSRILLVVTA